MLCTLHSDKWTEFSRLQFNGATVMRAFERAAHVGDRGGAAQVVLDAMTARNHLGIEILHASSHGLMDIVIGKQEGASGVADMIAKAFELTKDSNLFIVKSYKTGILRKLLDYARNAETDDAKQAAVELFDRVKIHAPEMAKEEVFYSIGEDWVFKKSLASVLPVPAP